MFYGEFDTWDNVLSQFGVEKSEVSNAVPIFAAYDIDGYEGTASVVYVEDGKFWLVDGSHCSCYGLEDQWEPEETPYEVLEHLAEKGNYMFSVYKKEFMATINFIKESGFDNVDPKELEFVLKLSL